MEALRITRTHRHCLAWHLQRVDGFEVFVTDHNKKLTLFDGNEYTPQGGFTPSAEEGTAGLGATNQEIFGAITSAAITAEDLVAPQMGRSDDHSV